MKARFGGSSVTGQYEAIEQLLWSHPEWWVLAASAAAWVPTALHGARQWDRGHSHALSLSEDMLHWMLMIAAMMLPLIVDPLRTTAFRSLRSRRHRAMIFFLVGYLALWAATGLPAAWVRGSSGSHSRIAAGVAFLLAAIWLASPIRRRALVACHRTTSLAPSGLQADLDCLRFGLIIGSACAMCCWPLMLACTLTGHSLAALLVGATIGAVERFSFRTPQRALAAVQMSVAAFYLVPVSWG